MRIFDEGQTLEYFRNRTIIDYVAIQIYDPLFIQEPSTSTAASLIFAAADPACDGVRLLLSTRELKCAGMYMWL